MNDKSKRLEEAFNYLKSKGLAHTQKDISEATGYTQPNVSSAFSGNGRNLTDNFLKKFNSSYGNIFSLRWLLLGEGEMLKEDVVMIQEGSGSHHQQGRAGVDLTQNINSEKVFKDFISALKGQNEVAMKSMEQTSKAIESTNNALAEISKQREQMDRLISMIEKLQK